MIITEKNYNLIGEPISIVSDSVRLNCSMIENILTNGVILSDLIDIFVMSLQFFNSFEQHKDK